MPHEHEIWPAEPRGETNGVKIGVCQSCGAEFERSTGRGRPRKFCTTCVPPGTGGAAGQAWRAANPGRVEAYNAARRKTLKVRNPWAAQS